MEKVSADTHGGSHQWRMQKIFMVGVSFSGIWWPFLFGADLRGHLFSMGQPVKR